MANDKAPGPAFQEDKTGQLLKAALEAPVRPLRTDQIAMLLEQASVRRGLVPGWLLISLGLGPLLVIAGLAYASLSGMRWQGVAEIALLIPLVNLMLSPFAAGFVIFRLVSKNRRTTQEKK